MKEEIDKKETKIKKIGEKEEKKKREEDLPRSLEWKCSLAWTRYSGCSECQREAHAGADGAGETEVKLETETKETSEETKKVTEKKETQKEIHTGLGVAAGVESSAVAILESRGLKGEGETKGKEEKPPGAEVDLTATILGAGRGLKINN